MGPGETRQAAFKVFFDRNGRAERVQLLVSSRDRRRDAACIQLCQNMTIPIPRIGRVLAGQLWRIVRIPVDLQIPERS